MTMITPSYLGETIEYSSLHACRSTLEDPKFGEHVAGVIECQCLIEVTGENEFFECRVNHAHY